MTNQREKTGRPSEGQRGHGGTPLRQVATPDKVLEHFPALCRGCGKGLSHAHATGHQKRQVFDLPPPVVEVTEHRAHSWWCPRCGTETQAPFPADVTAATQYGARGRALVGYLQARQLIPEARVAELMGEVFGVELAPATIATMGQRKAQEWAGLAEQIAQQGKDGAVKHVEKPAIALRGGCTGCTLPRRGG